MTPVDEAYVAAEQRARILIDAQLTAAGWSVQDSRTLNIVSHQGVAVREAVMAPGHGRADYLLYVDRKVVGVIEAKPTGTTLSGVEWQSAMYASGLPQHHRTRSHTIDDGRLPFAFEASGTETKFTNGYDLDPRSRAVFAFPKPETLARFVREATQHPGAPTWRGRVRTMPLLTTAGLRPAQIDAVTGLEDALRKQQFDRSLIQMATGAGKTFTAVTSSYRLLKYGGFQRVLFLVDRNNLADQTLGEFSNYRTPDDGRRFTELYPVDKLTSAGVADSASVVISTIQRLHRVLQGGVAPAGDDPDLDDFVPDAPVTVSYNEDLPPESFDLVIVDEAHRSIYGVWRSVLEYFDAHVVGLTATPGRQTFAFFRQNLVSEYTYPQSVADKVNVDFDIFRIRTERTEQGGSIEAGTVVPTIDRRTRVQRYTTLEEDLDYRPSQLDRAVTSRPQIRLVLETFRDRLFTEIFPGRSTVPKTLIFCKDDAHAEEVVTAVREVFGKGNDFAAKITYAARDPKGHLQAFRNSPTLRIAVTVDMIATGTDVKPLECVFFMRDVRSGQYFEQMKGRGARTIEPSDFQAVTPDAEVKTRFVIVDAVGVTEHPFVDAPLNRIKGISLKQLLGKVATLTITQDETATLASRLAALELQLTPAERTELNDVAGRPLQGIVRGLIDAVDPDVVERAVEASPGSSHDDVVADLVEAAITPLAANPELRARILELRQSHDRVIDENADVLLDAYGVIDPDRARSVVESWQAYLEEHRAEITAIQLLSQAQHDAVPFASIKELADRIARPPHSWTIDLVWQAYEQVEAGRVRHNDRARLTDLVSLLRFTFGFDGELVPYAERVRERFAGWLLQQDQAGVVFGESQRWWLDRIAEVVAASAGVSADDLESAPFTERGGIDGAVQALGADRAAALLDEMNRELTA
ncbi:DEAD/DEAH box helicase family protein [Serinibacter arcticus]|uniref:type I restriction endonuclease subunit R n=1 Tax=Serinibacter arcticus TaxID=1655435 RepID=UPI0018EE6F2F|nr:DEAD/DEAH box helicase family protein [Serinibacter arcticus]